MQHEMNQNYKLQNQNNQQNNYSKSNIQNPNQSFNRQNSNSNGKQEQTQHNINDQLAEGLQNDQPQAIIPKKSSKQLMKESKDRQKRFESVGAKLEKERQQQQERDLQKRKNDNKRYIHEMRHEVPSRRSESRGTDGIMKTVNTNQSRDTQYGNNSQQNRNNAQQNQIPNNAHNQGQRYSQGYNQMQQQQSQMNINAQSQDQNSQFNNQPLSNQNQQQQQHQQQQPNQQQQQHQQQQPNQIRNNNMQNPKPINNLDNNINMQPQNQQTDNSNNQQNDGRVDTINDIPIQDYNQNNYEKNANGERQETEESEFLRKQQEYRQKQNKLGIEREEDKKDKTEIDNNVRHLFNPDPTLQTPQNNSNPVYMVKESQIDNPAYNPNNDDSYNPNSYNSRDNDSRLRQNNPQQSSNNNQVKLNRYQNEDNQSVSSSIVMNKSKSRKIIDTGAMRRTNDSGINQNSIKNQDDSILQKNISQKPNRDLEEQEKEFNDIFDKHFSENNLLKNDDIHIKKVPVDENVNQIKEQRRIDELLNYNDKSYEIKAKQQDKPGEKVQMHEFNRDPEALSELQNEKDELDNLVEDYRPQKGILKNNQATQPSSSQGQQQLPNQPIPQKNQMNDSYHINRQEYNQQLRNDNLMNTSQNSHNASHEVQRRYASNGTQDQSSKPNVQPNNREHSFNPNNNMHPYQNNPQVYPGYQQPQQYQQPTHHSQLHDPNFQPNPNSYTQQYQNQYQSKIEQGGNNENMGTPMSQNSLNSMNSQQSKQSNPQQPVVNEENPKLKKAARMVENLNALEKSKGAEHALPSSHLRRGENPSFHSQDSINLRAHTLEQQSANKSVPHLGVKNILNNVYHKDIHTNSYLYKNLVRKNVQNGLPQVNSRKGSRQGSVQGSREPSENGSVLKHNRYDKYKFKENQDDTRSTNSRRGLQNNSTQQVDPQDQRMNNSNSRIPQQSDAKPDSRGSRRSNSKDNFNLNHMNLERTDIALRHDLYAGGHVQNFNNERGKQSHMDKNYSGRPFQDEVQLNEFMERDSHRLSNNQLQNDDLNYENQFYQKQGYQGKNEFGGDVAAQGLKRGYNGEVNGKVNIAKDFDPNSLVMV